MKIDRGFSSSKTSAPSGVKAEAKSINQLSKGDTFKAVVLDIQKNFIQLRLSDGSTFQAKILQQLQARIGQEVEFLVTNQESGQILLEMVKNDPQWEDLVPKMALQQAHMELTEENLAMVKGLVQKGLPIDVQSLEKAFYFLSQNITVEEALFLLQENFPAELKSMEQFFNYQTENMKNDIKELIQTARELNMDTALFDPEELALLKTAENLKESLMQLSPKDRPAFLMAHLPEGIPKETLEKNPAFLKAALFPGQAREALLLMQEEDLADINQYYEKLVARLGRFISQNKDNEVLAKGVRLAEKTLHSVEFMEQLGAFKQYIELPLFFNQTQKGELYIFQKKKDNQKLKDKATVLLSLDMAFFGHLEVLIQKEYQNIACQFGLDEKWHSLFKNHMPALNKRLQEKGVHLINVQYKTLEESFHIAKEIETGNTVAMKNFSFDMRV